jgi:hypothetical protein
MTKKEHTLPDPADRIPSLLRKRNKTFNIFLGIGMFLMACGIGIIFFNENHLILGLSTPPVVFGLGFIRRYFSLREFNQVLDPQKKIAILEREKRRHKVYDFICTFGLVLGFIVGIIAAAFYREAFFSGLGLSLMFCSALGLLFLQIVKHLDHFLIREWQKIIKSS